MPEFIQPETKTVGLGEKIEFDHSLEHSELKEKFIKMYEQDPDSAWLGLITTIISTGSPEEILEHHGINGQKWGVRNGPPYPLDEENHSSREKKRNWKLSLNNKKDNKQLTSKEKAAIKRNKDKKKYELEKKILNVEGKILLGTAAGILFLTSPLGQMILNTSISLINNVKMQYDGKKIINEYMESEFGKVIYKKGKTIIYGGLKNE